MRGATTKVLIGAACAAAFGATVYVVSTQPSIEQRLAEMLSTSSDGQATVSIEGCELVLLAETVDARTGNAALSRLSVRLDMRQYDFETVLMVPSGGGVTYRAKRGPTTASMLDQAQAVMQAVPAEMSLGRSAIRDILDADGGSLTFRVMARVETADGNEVLIAHEDAPEFHGFVEAVEALPAPASYQATTTYSEGVPSADALLMGEVRILPPLQLTFEDEGTAKEAAEALYELKIQNCG